MAITRYAGDRFVIGSSPDTEPTGVLDGAFLINTGNLSQKVLRNGTWVTLAGGGGGSPGGSNTQVQFNDNGAFGGTTGLTFDGQRLYANNFQLSGILYDSNASVGEGGMVLANEGTTGVHWKSIESVLSGVGGSGVANYVARWSDEDTLTTGALVDDGTEVGIGTATPAYPLQIQKDEGAAADFQTNLDIKRGWSAGSATDRYVGLIISDNNSVQAGIYANRMASHANYSSDLVFYTNAGSSNMTPATALTERMIIKADGKVGIGTPTPDDILDVTTTNGQLLASDYGVLKLIRGTAGDYGSALQFIKSDNGGAVTDGAILGSVRFFGHDGIDTATEGAQIASIINGTPSANVNPTDIVFKTASTGNDDLAEKVRIMSNGNVGIGTTAPAGRLHIETTGNEKSLWIAPSAATTTNVLHLEADSLTTGSAVYIHSNNYNTGTRKLVYINNDHASATGTTALYINQDSTGPALVALGNVGIGTAVVGANQKLDVVFVDDVNGAGVTFRNTDGSLQFQNVAGSASQFNPQVKGNSKHVNNVGLRLLGNAASGEDSGTTPLILLRGTVNNAKATTRPVLHIEDGDGTKLVSVAADGNVGINTILPEHKLHVSGDAIISGVLYDSTNSSGVSGHVLTSEVGGPQWKMIEDVLSGVGGNGTANYIPKWEDSDTIGDSVIYDDGNVGIATATPEHQFHVNGDAIISGKFYDQTNSTGDKGYVLTSDDNGPLWKASGDFDGLSGDLITTGQTLTTNLIATGAFVDTNTLGIATNVTAIALNASNLVLTGAIVDDVSGNLITTGQTLTTNLIATGAFVDTNTLGIATNVTAIALNASNLVLTGNFLESEIDIVSGLIPPTVVDGAGVANYTARWSDGNTLTTGALVDDGTKVGIGTDTPLALLHLQSTGTLEPVLRIENTHTDHKNPMIHLVKSTTNEADDDYVGQVDFKGMNSAGEETPYGRLQAIATDVTDGEEDGRIYLASMKAGALDATLNVTSGKVGIGVAAPDSKLTVRGDIELSDSTYTNIYQLKATSYSTGRYPIGAIKFDEKSTYNGEIQFWTTPTSATAAAATLAHTQRMVIQQDGNVGIGITTPGYQLHVKAAGSQNIAVTSTDSHAAVRIDRFNTSQDANLIFQTAGVNKWRLATGLAGNDEKLSIYDDIADVNMMTFLSGTGVGITMGADAPTAPLDVKHTAADNSTINTAFNIYTRRGTSTPVGFGGKINLKLRNNSNDAAVDAAYLSWAVTKATNGDLQPKLALGTGNAGSPSDRLTILYDGKVGIATDTPVSTLAVSGRISGVLGINGGKSLGNLFATTLSGTPTVADTGVNLPTVDFRGVVWTGNYYIFTEYANNKRAYFYDANFNQIENESGNTYFTLTGDNPHGATFDGSSLYVYCYGDNVDEIRSFDITTGTHTGTYALPWNDSGHGFEYANGVFYSVRHSTGYLYCWNFEGGSFTERWSIDISATVGTNSVQGIAFDGQHLWMVWHESTNLYKFDLAGNSIATYATGINQMVGVTWNGEYFVTFKYSAKDIYRIIPHTKKHWVDNALFSAVSATTLESTVAIGTAPLEVTSNTVVTNLNADLLDGQHGAYYATAANLIATGTTNAAGIVTNASAIADNTSNLIATGTTNAAGIVTNASAIADNTSNLLLTGATNAAGIVTNAAAIADNTSNLIASGTTNAAGIVTNAAAIADNTSNLIATGAIVDDVSGNLITTGQFLTNALPVGANPSAVISGAATNGLATTFMRSDAAPALKDTEVTAGSYTYTAITVDAQGRLTAASDGVAPGGGTVTSNGSAGYIPRLSTATNLEDSIIFQETGKILLNGTTALGPFGHWSWAPTFQQLGTQGIACVRCAADVYGGALQLVSARGSNAAPTIILDDDRAGGVYFHAYDGVDFKNSAGAIECFIDGTPGADDTPGRLVFSTTPDGSNGFAEQMRITSDGNVGIGTNAPATALDVVGEITGLSSLTNTLTRSVAGNSLGNVLSLIRSTAGTPGVGFGSRFVMGSKSSTTEAQTQVMFDVAWTTATHATRTADLAIQTVNSGTLSEKFRITGAGKVGIGTAVPSTILEVATSANSSDGTFSSWSTSAAHSGTIIFKKSASNTIGTYLETADDERLGTIAVYGSDSSNTISQSSAAIYFLQDGDATGSRVPSRITFLTSPSANNMAEVMQINSVGNVGIGTTAPIAKLQVSGRIGAGELGNSKVTRNGLNLYVDFNDKACVSGTSSSEVPLDLGPNNYSMTLFNQTFFEYKDGIGTYRLDGTADAIKIANFVVSGNANSYEFWFYANSQSSWETLWDSGTEKPLLGTLGSSLRAYPNATSHATISTGKWYHVVWAFASNSDLDVFVNGTRVTEANNWGSTQRTGTFEAWIGEAIGTEAFNGWVSIVRAYSRQLTPADVLQNYNAEVGTFAVVTPELGIVQSGGNVGIGTDAPEATLTVAGPNYTHAIFRTNQSTASERAGGGFSSLGHSNSVSRYARMFLDADGANFSGTDYFTIEKFGNGGEVRLINYGNAYMTFWVNTSTEALVIKNDGNVGIGTSTPSKLLDVNGTSYFRDDIYFGNTALNLASNYSNQTGMGWDKSTGELQIASTVSPLQLGRHGSTGSIFVCRYESSVKATIDTSGNMSLSGTLTEASSLAIKENIETYSPSLENISKIRPVRYNKKKSKKKEVGLVAEELAEMFPELVEMDEKGNAVGVNYSRAVAVLLHGFKELYKEVKELKEKI